MAEKMKVELGAEIKEFQTKLKEAVKGLDKLKQEEKSLKKEFDKGAISADKYYKQLAENSAQSKKLSANTNKLKSSLAGLDKNMSKTAKETANGSSAMLAFSRTVQDAPFGLLGISNNITNLTEQFGALKNRTGSAGGALKLMLRDLKGFGGITFGISVATSLLLVFGDKIFKTKDKVKDLRKEQEDLNKSLDNYVFGLETVNRANLKGSQNAQKELVTLRLLKEQVNDTTISLSKRKDALNQLRDKYPSYLKNMSDEKALNGGLDTIYKDLTKSILARARATAVSNQIVKNQSKLLTLQSQLKALEVEKGDLFDNKERLGEVRNLSLKHRFFHNQLEFIEVFKERGGFDLIVGNPPWVNITMDEAGILSEKNPELFIRKLSSPEVKRMAANILGSDSTLAEIYSSEYIWSEATKEFLGSMQNYPLLQGQRNNLYKCIVTNSFQQLSIIGFSGLVHPEGIYDDPKGQEMRKEVYSRLSYHFQFKNELMLES